MTDSQWLACKDPERMLDYHRMKHAKRKLRLLACACARRLWLAVGPSLDDPAFAALVEAVEGYADGAADRAAFVAARKPFRKAARARADAPRAVQAAFGVLDCISHDAMEGMTAAISNARCVLRGIDPPAAQCDLIRCVFAAPSHPVTLDRSLVTPAVTSLARAAYDHRQLPTGQLDPARLAVLSDALEEAGCTGEVLAHLRSPGPHVRGCWPLDLALGKE
jgi:hypothetical protein